MDSLRMKLMTLNLQVSCRKQAASQAPPGRGMKVVMVQGQCLDVVCDDGGSRTLDTSSKVTVSGVDDDPSYAPTQVSVISSPEEAGKRRRRTSKFTSCEEICEDTKEGASFSSKCGPGRGS